MKRRYNWFMIGSILVASGLFAVLTLEWQAVSILLVLMVIGLLVKPIKTDNIGQIIVALFCLAGAYTLTIVLGVSGAEHPPGSIGPVGATAALFFLFVAVTRLFMQAPWLGDRGTVVPTMIAVLSVGEVSQGAVFPTCAIVSLVLSIQALRIADPNRPQISTLSARHRLGAAMILVISTLITTFLVVSLPLSYEWAFSHLEASFSIPRTGFVSYMRLGSQETIIQSDTVVLRVYGPRPDHLRGAVYTVYLNGIWIPKRRGSFRPVELDGSQTNSPDTTEIISVGGDRDRYFVPLFATKIGVDGNQGRIDSFGIIMSRENEDAQIVRFVNSSREIPKVAPPSKDELTLPEDIGSFIVELAQKWSVNASRQQSKFEAIEKHLKQNFAYSLSFEQKTKNDPLVAFLTEVRAGHCEYFASALALLGRGLGVPTRVVSGYRVHEYNSFGDYHVVRDLNAHSWVEAWFPEVGWQTYDPTPETELFEIMPNESSILFGLADYIAAETSALIRRLSQASTSQILGTIIGLIFFWLLLRTIRALRLKKTKTVLDQTKYSDSLPALDRLLRALDSQGERLRLSEPLERFARRLESSIKNRAANSEAAVLLNKYVAWRYGHHGDKQTLTQKIDDWILRL
jgi:Transglutaminase-like superfamily/TgpA N-terminal domain